MKRLALVAVLLAAVAAGGMVPASAEPTRCEGLFYGIEASCMLRRGGSNIAVFGVAYRNDNPPAQFVVEVFKLPVSVGDTPLARCDTTNGGVLRECHGILTGTGSLPSGTMLSCRIHGIAQIGAFGCATF